MADPHFLREFHASAGAARNVHIEPWQPPTFNSEAGFAKQRRMLYTTATSLQGLPWLPGSAGASQLSLEAMALHAHCHQSLPMLAVFGTRSAAHP